MDKETILKDIEALYEYTPTQPEFRYYVTKVRIETKQLYLADEISLNESREIQAALNLITDKHKYVDTIKVFEEYYYMKHLGSNILSVLSLEDILFANTLCTRLLKFTNNGKDLSLLSTKGRLSSIEKIMNRCQDKFDNNKRNSELLQDLSELRNIFMLSVNTNSLNAGVKMLTPIYINWETKILEESKEFFYLPKIRTDNKLTDLYGKDKKSIEEDPNNYFEYYKRLFTIKTTELYLLTPEDFVQRFEGLRNTVKSIGLGNDEVNVILQIMMDIRNFDGEIRVKAKAISNCIYNKPEYLSAFTLKVVENDIDWALQYVQDFDLDSMIKYTLSIATQCLASSQFIDIEQGYNQVLEEYFKLFVEYDLMTPSQKESLLKQLRR